MVLLHGLLLFLAADAQAHAALHPEAAQPGHECVLTLLTEGKVSVAGETVEVSRPDLVASDSVPFFPGVVLPGPAHLLPPSCGPPLAAR